MPHHSREPSTDELFEAWRAAESATVAAEIAAGRAERVAVAAEHAAVAAERHAEEAGRATRIAHDRYMYRMDELEVAGG